MYIFGTPNSTMKAEVKDLLRHFQSLPEEYRNEFLAHLEMMNEPGGEKYIEETRHRDGVVCPFCGGHDCLKKHGRENGRQRYMCKATGRTFRTTTGCVMYRSHKSLAVWKKYLTCMFNGYSIRKSAEECNITPKIAFAWRHKILDSLRVMMDEVKLDGIVEADEAFLRVSYKGNHTKSKSSFTLPRKAHKRGNEAGKRGISKEQVCFPCAVNRKGMSYAKVACVGRPTNRSIQRVLGNNIVPNSTLCTDSTNAYDALVMQNGLEHISIASKQRLRGMFHIQHINAYHSTLKTWIERFKGVSTKHLNNYLVFHNFINRSKGTVAEKTRILVEQLLCVDCYTEGYELAERPAIPAAA